MAQDLPAAAESPRPARRRSRARTVAKWTGIVFLGLLVLVAAFLVWLNSDAGRRYIVRQINNIETASGLDIDIERIEGWIFGDLTIHGLTLKDPKGTFFYAPTADLEYRPLSYFSNHIDIESLDMPRARLMRLPELRPGDPDAPLLPDIDIDIGRLTIGQLFIDPAVTGRRHVMNVDTNIKIADGRAQVGLNLSTLRAQGIPGGDRLAMRIDSVPEANQLDIALAMQGPADGFIAGVTGLNREVLARIDGRGSWADWRGRARAAIGGQPFATLDVTAREGTYSVRGPIRLDLVTQGQMQRLVGPLSQLNLVTTLDNRRADLRLRVNSKAAAISAEGMVDLGRNRFDDLRVGARLIEPGAIAPNLRGRDVRVALLLNGDMATPTVGYDLRAVALGFGATTIEGLSARGRAQVRGDRIVVPVVATARRITGLDPAVGGLLTNVSLAGDLAISGSQIVSDNIRIRSDRLVGTAVIAFDLARGIYRTGLQGRVDNYRIDGVGLIDLTTDVDVVARGNGFGLSGRFVARTRRIDNASIRDFLGGSALVSANLAMNPSGSIRFDSIRVTAPLLRVTSGEGTYHPNGRLDFRLRGNSNAYGPLTVRITGTQAAPQVSLVAANPGFGIGLRGVTATVRSTAQGWAITARGDSAYGPFTADVVVLTRRGPMTIRVNRLTLGGINFSGRLTQSRAGPWVGTLTMSGQGLEGVATLGAEGSHQRVEIAASANGAQIPGDVPITIQRAMLQATAVLYPDAPSIVGDLQVAGLRSGQLSLETARARINYRGGTGSAQLVAKGRNAVPFDIAANAALTPNHIRAAARGSINAIPFRFAQPADIRWAGGEWQLAPTTIVLPQGNVRLAGRYGDGLVVQSRLDNLDLSIVNAFSPGLGIGGRATGSLDFSQPRGSSFPRAEARLNIAGFTRSGIAVRSEAVDLALAGSLKPEGGALAATIRRGGTLIGRVQARLQPLGPEAGSWTTRMFAAPLSGGIRYNGPADVLMSLAGMAGHQLSGPIAVGADFSGRVQTPQFAGIVRANNLTYVNEDYGTRITNLALEGRFGASQLEIVRLSGRAGEGTVTGQGRIGLASAAGFPIDLRFRFDNAQLARSDDLGATVTGDVTVTNTPQRALIAGTLELPEVRYQIIRQAASEVPQLAGVRRRGEPLAEPGSEVAEGVPSIWELDLRVRADNRVFVAGMGLESEWSTDLHVQGTSATPSIVGNLDLIRGTLSVAGRRFNVEEGRITFTGARPPNPRLNIRAVADIENVEVAINIDGSANNPQIAFSSQPGLPQDEIVARILFGSSVTEISALQAVQVAASLNSLRGGGGGLNPMGRLRSATGIDRLRILGADDTTGRGTALAAGMYISDDIYIEIITDARGFTATQLEISLTKALSMISQFGSGNSGTNVNVRYSRDY
ncbi:translocation/assembly module TamB domain-containing protein [Allosphingosinicella sp.]|jgi:translocation and assembly module TamB|uniref:translocation/assembly module TamB domain-containing protein n=1 Tax=Allosphingosinicella sp. TaxID=2823234 RepID=UPI002F11DAFF